VEEKEVIKAAKRHS